MKSATFLSFLSLATLALAAPKATSYMRRQSNGVSQETILGSITEWKADIEAVNKFLIMAGGGNLAEDDFRGRVSEAAVNEEFKDTVGDELTQLKKLLPVVGVENERVLALLKEMNGGEMVAKLQKIQIEGLKSAEESKILDRLNEFEESHCKMLSNLDDYWKSVMDKAGIAEGKRSGLVAPKPNLEGGKC